MKYQEYEVIIYENEGNSKNIPNGRSIWNDDNFMNYNEYGKNLALYLDDALQLSSYPKNLLGFFKQFLIDNYSDNDMTSVYLYRDKENIFLAAYTLNIKLLKKSYNINILVYFPILFPEKPPEFYIKKTINVGLHEFYKDKIDSKDFKINLDSFIKFDKYRNNIREIIDNLAINFSNKFPIFREAKITNNNDWKNSGKCVFNINKINKVII